MPGHVKKSSGPDADPSPWLEVNYELMQKKNTKTKKCSHKNSDGGHLEGLIETENGGEINVFRGDQICPAK